MFKFFPAAARPVRAIARVVALAGILVLTGCATHYTDGAVKDVSAAQFTRGGKPAQVQLVYEFQTKGAANARATEHTRTQVQDVILATGLFTGVSDAPAVGGLLSVTINNVVLTDEVFAKAFMTGLTFGVAGSTVTDGYICTVRYLPAGTGAAALTKTTKHAIHTALGVQGVPAGAVKATNIDEAVSTMVRQIVSNALNDLSKEPSFNK